MGLFEGKRGLILGVANERSIAWAIAREILEQGGQCGFSHLPDRADDPRRRNHRRVAQCIDGYEGARFLLPLDVRDDEQIHTLVERGVEEFGRIDFLLHSIAFADRRDLQGETVETSRAGFAMAMEISAYSLLAVANAAKDYMSERSAIATMTFQGSEKCIPGYNVMGICKAALEASVRYLAFDLGPRGIRVNALSAGPLRTLASMAAGVERMQTACEQVSPLRRNITHEEAGRTGAFLLSDMSNGITGEVLHVDAGYHAMGAPGEQHSGSTGVALPQEVAVSLSTH